MRSAVTAAADQRAAIVTSLARSRAVSSRVGQVGDGDPVGLVGGGLEDQLAEGAVAGDVNDVSAFGLLQNVAEPSAGDAVLEYFDPLRRGRSRRCRG
jgi:hypothetical protein